ncbi:hypothetical protein ABDZ24_00230 (plasmid) [Bacillus paramobilis]
MAKKEDEVLRVGALKHLSYYRTNHLILSPYCVWNERSFLITDIGLELLYKMQVTENNTIQT